MSKTLEKVVSAQLCSFLQKNDLCEEFQSGFRPHHSTETSKLSKLTECVKNVKDWMTNNFLLLNSDKTEILLIVPKNSTQNLLDYNLHLDGCPVTSSTVKNLGVILDSNLSFENHISNVTKTAFFHLRNLSKLRNMLPVSDAEKLVHAFMTSRLDYCNALLGGCPASSINKLQVVQNAAARVLTRSRKYDHITPILQSLHWLPIKFRISYKILLLTYKALNGLAPAYLTSLLSRYNPSRSLRSQNSGLLVVPRIAKSTKGGRAFSFLAPKLWNSLPDNVRGSDTLSLFKSRLKTHLFSQAFT